MDNTEALFEKHMPFVAVSNVLVQDKRLSLKARGLACYMFSLPSDWTFSYRRLMETTGEGERAIRGALNELIDKGYLVRTALRSQKGFGHCKYDLYMEPQNVCIQNVCLQNVGIQNVGAYKENSNKENNNKINNSLEPPKKERKTKPKYKNGLDDPTKTERTDFVAFTPDEYKKIVKELGSETDALDYIDWFGKKKVGGEYVYSSDYRASLKWGLDSYKEHKARMARFQPARPEPKIDMSKYDIEATLKDDGSFLDMLLEEDGNE